MFTEMQKRVIDGLAKIESKNYATRDIVHVLKCAYEALRVHSDDDLEELVTASLYQE